MNWIIILVIGLALGWALELLFDVLFWGRRNRSLESRLAACRSDFQSSKTQLNEALTTVSQYQARENEFNQCQLDLVQMADRHDKQKTLNREVSAELERSQGRVEQLSARVDAVALDRDQLHDTLETVDHWVEASMRQHIWDAAPWQQKLRRSKAHSVAYAQAITAKATSRVNRASTLIGDGFGAAKQQAGRAAERFKAGKDNLKTRIAATAGKINGGTTKIREHYGRAKGQVLHGASSLKHHSGQWMEFKGPRRLLMKGYCMFRSWIGPVFKNSPAPRSCELK